MPVPEDRPGTHLTPIDKAYRARETAPDAHDTTAGIAWAVWEESSLIGEPYVVAVMVSADGDYIKQRRGDSYGGGSGKRLYRLHSSVEDVQWACIKHAARQADDPLGEVQDTVRRETEGRTRRIHHDRRELNQSEVVAWWDKREGVERSRIRRH
jgi:hypothetical protein